MVKEDQSLDQSKQWSRNRGNFIAIVKAFAKHDYILRNYFFKGPQTVRYISPRIQNKIISVIAEIFREKFCEVL